MAKQKGHDEYVDSDVDSLLSFFSASAAPHSSMPTHSTNSTESDDISILQVLLSEDNLSDHQESNRQPVFMKIKDRCGITHTTIWKSQTYQERMKLNRIYHSDIARMFEN